MQPKIPTAKVSQTERQISYDIAYMWNLSLSKLRELVMDTEGILQSMELQRVRHN